MTAYDLLTTRELYRLIHRAGRSKKGVTAELLNSYLDRLEERRSLCLQDYVRNDFVMRLNQAQKLRSSGLDPRYALAVAQCLRERLRPLP